MAKGENQKQIHEVRMGFATPGAGVFGVLYSAASARFVEYMQEAEQKNKAKITLNAYSGTSAGAVNSVLYTHHANKGTLHEAPESARRFWNNLTQNRMPFSNTIQSFFSMCSVDQNDSWPNIPTHIMRSLQSMQALMPAGFCTGVIRELLDNHIGDFQHVQNGPCKVFINATEKTARNQYKNVMFHGHEITADHVAASGALEVFGAHKVNGKDFYDGAYAENPSLNEIIKEDITDLFVITTHSVKKQKSALDGNLHTTTIHDKMDALMDDSSRRFHLHGLHFIPPEGWNPTARLNPDPTLVNKLWDEGYRMMDEWLEKNAGKLGRESTYLKQDHPHRDHTPAQIKRPVHEHHPAHHMMVDLHKHFGSYMNYAFGFPLSLAASQRRAINEGAAPNAPAGP